MGTSFQVITVTFDRSSVTFYFKKGRSPSTLHPLSFPLKRDSFLFSSLFPSLLSLLLSFLRIRKGHTLIQKSYFVHTRSTYIGLLFPLTGSLSPSECKNRIGSTSVIGVDNPSTTLYLVSFTEVLELYNFSFSLE